MNNWYIGQRIVAIEDHVRKVFKRGDEFTIHGLKNSECRCSAILIDIGIRGSFKISSCKVCDHEFETNGVGWFKEYRFAPLDELEQAIEELLEQSSKVTL